jgi:hypothetical protein
VKLLLFYYNVTVNPATPQSTSSAIAQRTIEVEGHSFQQKWVAEYFHLQRQSNIVCLICQRRVALAKNIMLNVIMKYI